MVIQRFHKFNMNNKVSFCIIDCVACRFSIAIDCARIGYKSISYQMTVSAVVMSIEHKIILSRQRYNTSKIIIVCHKYFC